MDSRKESEQKIMNNKLLLLKIKYFIILVFLAFMPSIYISASTGLKLILSILSGAIFGYVGVLAFLYEEQRYWIEQECRYITIEDNKKESKKLNGSKKKNNTSK